VREELLRKAMEISPAVFERLVAELLKKMHYGEPKVVGRSGDGGVDSYCSIDELGIDKVLFQAKRWKNPVSPDKVREFVGAVSNRKARGGILIATSHFGTQAIDEANSARNIVLVDGNKLTELMVKFDLGVRKKSLEVAEVDEEYFDGL
jgi:restriction system protein